MSKNSYPILYRKLLYKMGQDFYDIQYPLCAQGWLRRGGAPVQLANEKFDNFFSYIWIWLGKYIWEGKYGKLFMD